MYDSIDIRNNAKIDFDGVPQQYLGERSDGRSDGGRPVKELQWDKHGKPKNRGKRGLQVVPPERARKNVFFFQENVTRNREAIEAEKHRF